jgi:hypothetical protein
MKAKTIKEALIATRWIIDNVGWCQGRLYRTKPGKDLYAGGFNYEALDACCLEGALNCVETEVPYNEAWNTINAAVSGGVVYWNDAPGRTKQEVLDMLDGIIAKLP